MKYRFEKMERKLTAKEKKQRSLIALAVLGVAVLCVLILYGTMWYRYLAFKAYVAGFGEKLTSGKLVEACDYVRYRDRAKATAAARWAQVSGHDHEIAEMHILSTMHTPGWKEWQTDVKFRIPSQSYPNLFIRIRWIKEQGKWEIDFDRTYEYDPLDNTTSASVTDLLKEYSGLDLDSYEQADQPPDQD